LEPDANDNKHVGEDRLLKIEEESCKLGARFSRMEALLAGLVKEIAPS